jgi:hypothetical protein
VELDDVGLGPVRVRLGRSIGREDSNGVAKALRVSVASLAKDRIDVRAAIQVEDPQRKRERRRQRPRPDARGAHDRERLAGAAAHDLAEPPLPGDRVEGRVLDLERDARETGTPARRLQVSDRLPQRPQAFAR